jgi:hypothetical protein
MSDRKMPDDDDLIYSLAALKAIGSPEALNLSP